MTKEKIITVPELALLTGTRVALGFGLGLLIADKFSRDGRKGAGWAMFGIGALSTVPIFMEVMGKRPSGTSIPIAA
jgi:hypothetical protein